MQTKNSQGSLAKQIRDDLAMQIQSGIRKPGTPLPSFIQLCALYSASLSSVNAAMRLLEKEKLIRPRSHRPALVCAPKTSRSIRRIALMTNHTVTNVHYANSPYAWLVYQHFLAAIMNRGYQCLMLSCMQFDAYSDLDGVIYWDDPNYQLQLPDKFQDTPLVCFSSCLSDREWNTVALRHSQGMYQSALYFIGHGVKSVYVSHMPPHYYGEMHESFEEMLLERGIKPDYLSSFKATCMNTEIARKEILEWLDRNPERPIGILCGGDLIARTALEIAVQKGLRIKEDIFVIGFTDLPEAARWTPKLTLQSVPFQELAENALAMLEKRIATGKNQPSVILDNKLIIRET